MAEPDPRPGIGRALARIPSGLFVLTAGQGQRTTGMLVSFVQQVGFEPPAVAVAVRKGRFVEDLIREGGTFCIAVLDEGSRRLLAHFARGFNPDEEAFAGIETEVSVVGVPVPTGASAHLACRLLGEAAGWSDHTVFCGEVVGGEGRIDVPPIVHVRRDGYTY